MTTQRFRIRRDWMDSMRPCDHAFEVQSHRVDRRTAATPEDLNGMTVEQWHAEGFDHTTWENARDRGIQRSFREAIWVVDLDMAGLVARGVVRGHDVGVGSALSGVPVD